MKKRSVLFLMCLVLIAALCLSGVVLADDSVPTVDNGIPVVYLKIDESRGKIEDMLQSPDHSIYCYGTISIDVPEGFHYSDFPQLNCQSFENLEMSIRGRGNSTWKLSNKKPFKIKLDKKADLFGLGTNKHWVLVANATDPTLLRDRITAWLGDALGCGFTPRGVPVDVVMVGESIGTQYLGSYYFSENVRVDDNRLEIAELKESDTDPHTITGGYLIQNSMQVRQGSPDIFYTSRGANWATHTPSFDTEELTFLTADPKNGEEAFNIRDLGDGYKNSAQQKYIQDYIQHFEDVLFEGGTAYRDLMDVENAAKYWLINMISRNSDAYATGSTYLYKDRDPATGVSKLYWGPLWDFDFAWENSSYTQGFEYGHLWMKPMFCDRGEGGFVQEVHKQWPKLKAALEQLVKDGGVIDQYYAETKASAESDARALRPDREFDYKANVDKLKNWIRTRVAWVDAHLGEVDEMVHKVTFLVDGKVYRVDYRTEGEFILGDEVHPEKESDTFVRWLDENGMPIMNETRIDRDRTFTALYVPDSEITHGKDIAFVKQSDILRMGGFFNTYSIRYQVIPADADNLAVSWSSSDESIATIDDLGHVTYSRPGTVTFTAKLKHGATRTFTLTILGEGEAPHATAIRPAQATVNMGVGEQSVCYIETDPTPAAIGDVTYESDHPEIVTVGEYGVLTAVAPGEATIRITAESRDENGERVTLETAVKVVVSEKAPEPTPEPTEEPGALRYTAVPDSADWKKASGKDIVFTVSRSEDNDTAFDHFTGVKVDGLLLTKDKDYVVNEKNHTVTLKPHVFQRLTVGKHTVNLFFDDGVTETTIQVLTSSGASGSGSSSSRSGAKTGDTRTIVLWVVLLAGGLAGVVYASRNMKKKQ